jgi:hypothetical protein
VQGLDEEELLNKKLKEARGSLMLAYNALNDSYDRTAEQRSFLSEMSTSDVVEAKTASKQSTEKQKERMLKEKAAQAMGKTGSANGMDVKGLLDPKQAVAAYHVQRSHLLTVVRFLLPLFLRIPAKLHTFLGGSQQVGHHTMPRAALPPAHSRCVYCWRIPEACTFLGVVHTRHGTRLLLPSGKLFGAHEQWHITNPNNVAIFWGARAGRVQGGEAEGDHGAPRYQDFCRADVPLLRVHLRVYLLHLHPHPLRHGRPQQGAEKLQLLCPLCRGARHGEYALLRLLALRKAHQ